MKNEEKQRRVVVGILMDLSNNSRTHWKNYQEAAIELANTLLPGDKKYSGYLIGYGNEAELMVDTTTDSEKIMEKLRKIKPGGGSALYDAIYLACNEKLTSEAGRKAIVLVTDAQDEGSKVRIEEAIEAAQRTDTVIHLLLVADSRFGGNSGVAHRLTEETDGRMIVANSEKHLAEAFDQISEELRSQYTLGYYPSNSTHDGKFRKIKVDMANHDLKVLARKGYYAPKGQ